MNVVLSPAKSKTPFSRCITGTNVQASQSSLGQLVWSSCWFQRFGEEGRGMGNREAPQVTVSRMTAAIVVAVSVGWTQTSLHSWNWWWCKKTCGLARETKSWTIVAARRGCVCDIPVKHALIICYPSRSQSDWPHPFSEKALMSSRNINTETIKACLPGLLCHSPPAAEMRRSSPYLSSSVCWARSCWAAARAARPCAKLCWEASGPTPPDGACGWGWGSAEGWGTCPAPCPCPGASTGGKGGWKAGEVCCFLPKVLLPLRRVWSECLLVVLHRESGETVRGKNKNTKALIRKSQIRPGQRITKTPEHREKSLKC